MWEKVLIPVLIIGGLNGLLSLFLVIAERFFANYGECTITINEKKSLKLPGGESLLNSLKSQKIFLPSACGGRGTCAYCKCRITDGGGTLLPTEGPMLSTEEIQDQVRLACQVKVKNDIRIHIPEALFLIKEFQATVTVLQDLTYDIKLVRLGLRDGDALKFTPGQYIQLQNKQYDKVKEIASRAYSIASANSKSQQIDLMIRLVPEGIVSTWIHHHLHEGDEVSFTGPMGDFKLHEGDGEIIMIAGGSGMAPMVSLLYELVRIKSSRKVTFLFGVVSKKDLFFEDTMKEFEKSISDFTFIPILSQPESDDNWQGETGLITIPLKEYLSKQDIHRTHAYLCGSPGMINACIKILNEKGITGDRIYFDPFA